MKHHVFHYPSRLEQDAAKGKTRYLFLKMWTPYPCNPYFLSSTDLQIKYSQSGVFYVRHQLA